MPMLYAVLVTVLFTFALGPEDTLLQRMAGNIALLAMLLTPGEMFCSGIEDESLEQLALSQ